MWPHHPEAKPGTYPPLPADRGRDGRRPRRHARRPAPAHHPLHRARRLVHRAATRTALLLLPRPLDAARPAGTSATSSAGKSAQGLYGDVIEEIDWSVGRGPQGARRPTASSGTRWSSSRATTAPGSATATTPATPGRSARARGPAGRGASACPASCAGRARSPPAPTCDAMLMTIDLLPTIARLVGAELPGHPIDGLDVWPLLAGEPGREEPARRLPVLLRAEPAPGRRQRRRPLEAAAAPHLSDPRRPARRPRRRRPRNTSRAHDRAAPSSTTWRHDVGETTDVAARTPRGRRRGCSTIAERARAELGDSLTKRVGPGPAAGPA